MGVWISVKSVLRSVAASLCLGVLVPGLSYSGSVAVHDPSIVIVYKDASGNSYPEQDANGSRTKYYYLLGTQNGGAYSRDMLNWTAFTPTYSVNGKVTSNYYDAFKNAAVWSNHTTSDNVKGNMWAPDIIWNKKLQKWCLYTSINGDDWMSSITLHTSDKIEGPYEYKGTVVWGGMDGNSSGEGNNDYKKVTGSSTIDSRYYIANNGSTNLGKWDGGYGVSCIDPNVFYDEDGTLWMLYGSWSGGLFLLKLDESTGLRDYSYTYSTKWSGTAFKSGLLSDEYMGLHLAGGYYVSGEGSYIQYFKDADGNGYYYLFISYGFYSPDGGYTMRVFRSKDVTGPYADVDGTSPIFSKYIYNYGTNTTYGFPIIENYKWSFWADGSAEIADGHNSLLLDEDGAMYLIYHRKMDNGTAWHNVETHQLFFNDAGWIVAAPFEYRVGYGLPKSNVTKEEIAGAYKVIMHDPYAQADGSYPINTEKDLTLSLDGSVTGAYSGSWTYDYRNGRSYMNLTLGGTKYSGVLLDQLENDVSKRTLTFSAMRADGERAFWGYRVPQTKIASVNIAKDGSESVVLSEYTDREFVGSIDAGGVYTTAFNMNFTKAHTYAGDFDVRYRFMNYGNGEGSDNWDNFIVQIVSDGKTQLLRADAFALDTVGVWKFDVDWNWDDFASIMRNAGVVMEIIRESSTVTYKFEISAETGSVYHMTAVNDGVSTSQMSIAFTCEASAVDVLSIETLNYPDGRPESSSSEAESSSSEYAVDPVENSSSSEESLAIAGITNAKIEVNADGRKLEFVNASSGNVGIDIFDAVGHRVYSSGLVYGAGTYSLDMGKFASGTYLVRIHGNSLNRVLRFSVR